MLYAGRVMSIGLSRQSHRLFSTQAPEAFLEPLQSHLGITCLSLNRPQAKNAISMKLLHVIVHPTPIPSYALNSLVRNSANV